MQIRLHNIVMHTKVLGPGIRTAIWFQGCKRECAGCMSPASRPLDGGRIVDADDVINAVIGEKNNIEGITVSGGEPFLQVDGLCYLLEAIRERTKLGVIIYSGFTMGQLRAMKSVKIDKIIDGLADLIIDGEYVDELNDGLALRGSSNQKLNFIRERYNGCRDLYESHKRDAEVFASEKDLFFVGIPSKDTLEGWKKAADDLKIFKDIPGEHGQKIGQKAGSIEVV